MILEWIIWKLHLIIFIKLERRFRLLHDPTGKLWLCHWPYVTLITSFGGAPYNTWLVHVKYHATWYLYVIGSRHFKLKLNMILYFWVSQLSKIVRKTKELGIPNKPWMSILEKSPIKRLMGPSIFSGNHKCLNTTPHMWSSCYP